MPFTGLQRLGFSLLTLGTVACVLAAATPFWNKGQVKINDLFGVVGGILSEFGIDMKLMEFNGGLLYFCAKGASDERDCRLYEFHKGTDIEKMLLGLLAGTVLLPCAAGLLCCCCPTCRTFAHGIAGALAAACGVGVLAIYLSGDTTHWAVELLTPERDWAVYVFGGGAGLQLLGAVMLCCGGMERGFSNVPNYVV